MTCDNIKAAGITLYTIQVNTDGDPTSSLLQHCASSADKFYLVDFGGPNPADIQLDRREHEQTVYLTIGPRSDLLQFICAVAQAGGDGSLSHLNHDRKL